MADQPEVPGGLGGDAAPDGPAIRDTRMQERAIRERWPMPRAVRVKVLQRLASIVDPEHVHDGGPPGHREAISASRALLSADRLNLEQEKLDLARAKAALGDPDDGADIPRLVIPEADDRPEPTPAG